MQKNLNFLKYIKKIEITSVKKINTNIVLVQKMKLPNAKHVGQ